MPCWPCWPWPDAPARGRAHRPRSARWRSTIRPARPPTTTTSNESIDRIPTYTQSTYLCAITGFMSISSDRRSRKRLATRQGISDVATRLFLERGFDHVTVDEIAAAADVGRMTVFNHFPRKEDMFFDRDEEGRELLRITLRQRDPRVAPIESLRLLTPSAGRGREPLRRVFRQEPRATSRRSRGSETLKARARAIRDEIAHVVALALSECVGREPADPAAHLAADLLLATWTVGLIQAHRTFRRTRDTKEAKAAFLAIVDQGTVGLEAAMAGTPYAENDQAVGPLKGLTTCGRRPKAA